MSAATSIGLEERRQLQRMRIVALIEGGTLLLLVFVAVPLKHLFGFPVATSIMGPIHGAAFLLYVWMLVRTLAGGDFSRSEAVHLLLAAVIPFGAFASERLLRRKQAA